MQKKIAHITVVLILVVATFSCDEPDCVSEFDNQIKISFFDLSQNEAEALYINKLTVIGESESESIDLIVDQAEVGGVIVPADPATSEITVVFNTREYVLDTLVLSYTNGSRLISEECGFELIFSELDYIRSDFDSIRVRNRILAEPINENIRVYNN